MQGTEADGAKALAEETLVPRGLVYSKSIRARVRIPAVRVPTIGVSVRIIGVRAGVLVSLRARFRHACTYANTRTGKRAHTHTHTRMHTHALTHKHTPTHARTF